MYICVGGTWDEFVSSDKVSTSWSWSGTAEPKLALDLRQPAWAPKSYDWGYAMWGGAEIPDRLKIFKDYKHVKIIQKYVTQAVMVCMFISPLKIHIEP